MSILIKGMEMPKSCDDCWFFGSDSARVGYCYLLKGELPLTDGVPQDCPLVEVPTPHGRLIDADALMKDGWKLHKEVIRMGGYAIHEKPLNYPDIPTIIESEGE